MRMLLFSVLFVGGCGMMDESEPPPPQPPGDINITIEDPDNPVVKPPSGAATSYPVVQEIIDRRCISCHGSADFVKSERQLRDSRAFEMVDRGDMPPNNPLQGDELKTFKNFFSSRAGLFD